MIWEDDWKEEEGLIISEFGMWMEGEGGSGEGSGEAKKANRKRIHNL